MRLVPGIPITFGASSAKVRQRLDDLEAQAGQQRVSERRVVLGHAGVRRHSL